MSPHTLIITTFNRLKTRPGLKAEIIDAVAGGDSRSPDQWRANLAAMGAAFSTGIAAYFLIHHVAGGLNDWSMALFAAPFGASMFVVQQHVRRHRTKVGPPAWHVSVLIWLLLVIVVAPVWWICTKIGIWWRHVL